MRLANGLVLRMRQHSSYLHVLLLPRVLRKMASIPKSKGQMTLPEVSLAPVDLYLRARLVSISVTMLPRSLLNSARNRRLKCLSVTGASQRMERNGRVATRPAAVKKEKLPLIMPLKS